MWGILYFDLNKATIICEIEKFIQVEYLFVDKKKFVTIIIFFK